jgi:hypothetical protein
MRFLAFAEFLGVSGSWAVLYRLLLMVFGRLLSTNPVFPHVEVSKVGLFAVL